MITRRVPKRVFHIRILRYSSSVILPDIDVEYYCNSKNFNEIKHNISIRKGVGNISRVLEAHNIFQAAQSQAENYEKLRSNLYNELCNLPNKTHPLVRSYGEEPVLVREIHEKRDFGNNKPLEFSEIARRLNLLRTDKLGHTCGPKSYFFLGELAELEEALIKYSVKQLLNKGFQLISVPDILPNEVLKSCGMVLHGDRTQVYSLDPHHHGPDLCLSGTAEMSLAGLLADTVLPMNKLPLKLAAVSRCYRAETSNVVEERGIYRVHQFTKVEMFIVSTPDQSEEMLEYVRNLQEQLFDPLGIHMKVIDMPPHELGAPAYRKYDIEAWMPGRNNYGEISSCSNCTDYQSRRLHIKYSDQDTNKFVHTLNGTACAVPRMLIALLETHQDPKGRIFIPEILQPFISGKKYITKNTMVPDVKILKTKK